MTEAKRAGRFLRIVKIFIFEKVVSTLTEGFHQMRGFVVVAVERRVDLIVRHHQRAIERDMDGIDGRKRPIDLCLIVLQDAPLLNDILPGCCRWRGLIDDLFLSLLKIVFRSIGITVGWLSDNTRFIDVNN